MPFSKKPAFIIFKYAPSSVILCNMGYALEKNGDIKIFVVDANSCPKSILRNIGVSDRAEVFCVNYFIAVKVLKSKVSGPWRPS